MEQLCRVPYDATFIIINQWSKSCCVSKTNFALQRSKLYGLYRIIVFNPTACKGDSPLASSPRFAAPPKSNLSSTDIQQTTIRIKLFDLCTPRRSLRLGSLPQYWLAHSLFHLWSWIEQTPNMRRLLGEEFVRSHEHEQQVLRWPNPLWSDWAQRQCCVPGWYTCELDFSLRANEVFPKQKLPSGGLHRHFEPVIICGCSPVGCQNWSLVPM